MDEQKKNTYCPECGKRKEYIDKPLCYDCWYKKQRKCRNCGKLIIDLPNNYQYCTKCNTALFHKTK